MITKTHIWKAKLVCDDCGKQWGLPLHVKGLTWIYGRCHLCNTDKDIIHIRNYGYLRKGMALLESAERTA